MFAAWRLASNIPLQIASFYNGDWDFTLYSEGMLALADGKTSPITVEQLVKRSPLEPDYLSIPDFVALTQQGTAIPEGKISPLALADSMETAGQRVRQLVQSIDTTKDNALRYEVGDILAWTHLGQYVAEKLRAATALHTYRQTQEPSQKTKAVQHAQRAVAHWEALVNVTQPLYRSVPLVHLKDQEHQQFHWSRYTEAIRQEADAIRSEK